jgi:tetraacyldisaccharide 4'-kinase
MAMGNAWLAPFSLFYGAAVALRHKLFDWKILRSAEYDIPVVCVGNITVGGTGKTPVTEMLAGHFKKTHNIAILSRGYKRHSKGYVEAEVNSSFLKVGDEPKLMKQRHPDVVVAVCEKRTEGIAEIRRNHPEVNLVILDDGFQHRYVEPWVNVVLMDYTRPVYEDHLLPWGRLRDSVGQLKRARHIIVTKCPPDMSPLDRRIVRKWLKLYPYQSLWFTSMECGGAKPLFPRAAGKAPSKEGRVVAMSGIANPAAFRKSLEQRYVVEDELVFPDHHPYRRRDLKRMERTLKYVPEGTAIVTTEKDAVKLNSSKKIPEELQSKLFYQPMDVAFFPGSQKEFFEKIDSDVKENPKYSLLNP